MHVLLIAPSNQIRPYPVVPLGPAYLAVALENAGHTVSLLDLCFEDTFEAIINTAVSSISPDLIAVSIRNIDSPTFLLPEFYLPRAAAVIAACRQATEAPVVLGGSGFSIMPQQIMEYCQADFGIIGEGEAALPALASYLQDERDPSRIPRLICRGSHGFSITAPEQTVKLDSLAHPQRVFDARYYDFSFETPRGVIRTQEGIQSKRGCGQACIYCTYPGIEGCRVRVRQPDDIVDELEALSHSSRASSLEFVDSVFNEPIEHVRSICREILRRNLSIQWSATCRPSLSQEDVCLMAEAGCQHIDFGTDTLAGSMLANLGKSFSKEDALAAARACAGAGVDYSHNIILGGPGETIDSIAETFEALEAVPGGCHEIMIGVRVYPGTSLETVARQEKAIPNDASLLEPTFFLSSQLTDEAFSLIESTAAGHRRDWHVLGAARRSLPEVLRPAVERYRQGGHR